MTTSDQIRRGRPRLEDIDKTLTALKPWLAMTPPMSKSSWYRRQKIEMTKAREAALISPELGIPVQSTIAAAEEDGVSPDRLQIVRMAIRTSNTSYNDDLGKARAVLRMLDRFDAAVIGVIEVAK